MSALMLRYIIVYKTFTCLPVCAVDEMYLACLINKGREAYITGTTNPTALPAETVLKMATINGAKAVLWDNEIGSLEVGKKVIPLAVILSCVAFDSLMTINTAHILFPYSSQNPY